MGEAEKSGAPATEARPATVAALEMTAVHKSYGHVTALHPTSFRVERGELLTLLGPSGSGKTTILGLAAGIVDPDGGRIFFHGRDVTDLPIHRREVGMVFQRYTLFPNKTVWQNVAFPLEVRKKPQREIKDRVAQFLDLVDLTREADRYPTQISGGQAQRVALARALVFEPALLLMDEPLGALDRRLRQTLQDEIRRIQRATQVPTLYVTHDQEEAMHLSDRIAVVRDGRIAEIGQPREVYESPASHWIAAFLGDVNARQIDAFQRVPNGTVEASLTGIGTAVARMDPTATNAARMMLIVRPERSKVTVKQSQSVNSFRGEVIETAYLGPVQRIRMKVGDDWFVSVTAPSHFLPIELGAVAFFEFDPAAALVVPA